MQQKPDKGYGFHCLDCGTVITREQAIKSGETFGRGLCTICALVASEKKV